MLWVGRLFPAAFCLSKQLYEVWEDSESSGLLIDAGFNPWAGQKKKKRERYLCLHLVALQICAAAEW